MKEPYRLVILFTVMFGLLWALLFELYVSTPHRPCTCEMVKNKECVP